MINVHAPWKKIKKQNIIYYFTWVYGWILEPCIACAGSGYYDNTGSPKCSSCEGSGRNRVRGLKSLTENEICNLIKKI